MVDCRENYQEYLIEQQKNESFVLERTSTQITYKSNNEIIKIGMLSFILIILIVVITKYKLM